MAGQKRRDELSTEAFFPRAATGEAGPSAVRAAAKRLSRDPKRSVTPVLQSPPAQRRRVQYKAGAVGAQGGDRGARAGGKAQKKKAPGHL